MPATGVTPPVPLLLPQIGLALTNLAWAAGYPLTALALRDISAPLLTVIRLGVAGLMCLPLLWHRPPSGARWDRRAVALAAALGLLGFAAPVYLQTVGLALSTPAITAILVALEPLLTAVLAVLLLRERLPLPRVLALGVALCGAWVIAGAPRPGHAGYLWGEAVLLLSIVCFAAYNALSSRLASLVGAPAATAGVLLAGFAGSLPIWALARFPVPLHLHTPALLSAAFLAVVGTGAAYLMWMYAVERMPVAHVAIFLYLQPVFGAALSVWLVRSAPGPGFYVGALLILGAVWTATAHDRRGRAADAPRAVAD